MVTRIDRQARSIKERQNIGYALNQQGVTRRATEKTVGRRSAAGKDLPDMPCVYRGRKPSIYSAEVWRLYNTEKIGALP
nr:Uncharacterised protein [Enterobacter ludwigii]